MSGTATLSVTISDDAYNFARDAIAAGQWDTMDQVIEAALHALRLSILPWPEEETQEFKDMLRERIAAHERNPVFVDPDDLLRKIEDRKAVLARKSGERQRALQP